VHKRATRVMAPRSKRKRKSLLTTQNKRRRQLQSSASTPASEPASERAELSTQEPEEWPAKSILHESARKFLVDWENHPTTGEQYPPNWVWKKDVTPALLAYWEEQKRTKRTSTTTHTAPASTSFPGAPCPPRRRRTLVPSSTPSAEQGGPADTASQVPVDPPTPDIRAFIEDTGSPEGSASYRPSTQDVTSTYVSTSGAPGSNSQILATQEDSGAGEATQAGYQETTTPQEGCSSYRPHCSASVDKVTATGDTVGVPLTLCPMTILTPMIELGGL
jgi:hypothetical protein